MFGRRDAQIGSRHQPVAVRPVPRLGALDDPILVVENVDTSGDEARFEPITRGRGSA
ncbi:hypothetical protein NSERUTF1_0510 [Nocardia seriolae]|nr:hypothetical protein NSERUTF1_0510 [Nocardia seriolae]